ncbi:SpoIIE family protein phosphatase [Streptomyces sp. NPDC047000]|uniref:SpoIIE family protein phosphatase n=1 Tax=Streptomyces sp. NPDC047000 TaxID=3155474 RepID=UPI0033DEA276
MCDARRVTSEPAHPPDRGTVPGPDRTAPPDAVSGQRAEADRADDLAATTAVLERAKGALMALTGCDAADAHDELLRRAADGGRTLMEECWITLGALRAAPRSGPPAAPVAPAVASSPAVTAPPAEYDTHARALARLGRDLIRAGSPQELAGCLLEHLAADTHADAVLLYTRAPGGGLELAGHAGVGRSLAERWSRVPPGSGYAAVDALEAGKAHWLEDAEQDRKRYVLIEDPPRRWHSRAWLPVPTGEDTATVALGVLRRDAGPFAPEQRELLRAVARLCAGRLRTFDADPSHTPGDVPHPLRAVFDVLPGATVLLTPLHGPADPASVRSVEDYRIDAATPQAVDNLGRTGRDLVGLRLLECFPAAASEPLWQGCLSTLATGEPFEGRPFTSHEVLGGVSRTALYSVRAARLGERLVLHWIRHDDADTLEQRMADVQRLANLGWASWNLTTGDVSWSPQMYAIFDRDPALGPVALERLADLVLPEDRPELLHAVTALAGEGRSFDLPLRIRAAGGTRHLRAVAEAVPDRHGTPAEVHGFVQDMTTLRRAELALVQSEQAILTQHGVLRAERALAARLQHALLPMPGEAVALAGLRVEVAYLPAQSGVHVGGDWFSSIELPDGKALFVVGDVAGHGVGAVATMAQLRFTAKGMVITGSSLTQALDRLNTLLLHSHDPHATATMVMACYDPGERRLVWAQAGHLPPLLVRDGEVRYLDRPAGVLLGASADPDYEQAECRLVPGDRVLFYTDGLVERPTEVIDAGLARLAEAVAGRPADGTGTLDTLLAAMLEGERRDDVCVLDLQVPVDDEKPGDA